MMTKRSVAFLFTITAVIYATSLDEAYAYLDPGTGSLLLQGVIGAIAAGIAFAGFYWQKFLAFFRGSKPQTKIDARDQRTD